MTREKGSKEREHAKGGTGCVHPMLIEGGIVSGLIQQRKPEPKRKLDREGQKPQIRYKVSRKNKHVKPQKREKVQKKEGVEDKSLLKRGPQDGTQKATYAVPSWRGFLGGRYRVSRDGARNVFTQPYLLIWGGGGERRGSAGQTTTEGIKVKGTSRDGATTQERNSFDQADRGNLYFS